MRNHEQVAPPRCAKRGVRGYRDVEGHFAPRSSPRAGARRLGKVVMGCTTGIHRLALPRPAGNPRLTFILLSNQLSGRCCLKRGKEGKEEEEVWRKTVATPLTSSHPSKELLLLEKCFLAGWETPTARKWFYFIILFCLTCFMSYYVIGLF